MRCLFVVTLVFVCVAGTAGASLIGDDVDASFALTEGGNNLFAAPTLTTDLLTATVGAGVEFAGGAISLDLDAESAVLTVANPGVDLGVVISPGAQLVVQDLDWVNDAGGMLTDLSNFGGELASAVAGFATTSDGFIIEFGQLVLPPMSTRTLTFDLDTDHASTPPVPEPATALLLAVGLAGFAAHRRRVH